MSAIFEGKVVLITGASGGIGAACARAFHRSGARLALTARNASALDAIAIQDSFKITADLTEAGECRRTVASTVDHFGRIDVLVNSAGVGIYKPAWESSLDEARAVFELNFFALLQMCQHAAAVMREQRSGTIVNISSVAGMITLPWFTLYSASKHAVCSLTDGLRMELRPYGVHAMSVCPGYVRTGFQQNVLSGTPPPALVRNRPLSITAEECASAIVRGVHRRARTVVVPAAGWVAVAASKLFPAFAERRLEYIYRSRV